MWYHAHIMTDNKVDFYENATRHLVDSLNNDFKLERLERMQAKNLTLLMRDTFKLPTMRRAIFGRDIPEFTYAADGMCRASSIAFLKLMNNPNWRLMYIDDLWTFGPHHYLMHMPSNRAFDLTYDQYTRSGISVAYNLGRPIDMSESETESADRLIYMMRLGRKQNG